MQAPFPSSHDVVPLLGDEVGALRAADNLPESFADGVVITVDVSNVNPLHLPLFQLFAQPSAFSKSARVCCPGAWGAVDQKLVGIYRCDHWSAQKYLPPPQISFLAVSDHLATVVAGHVASQSVLLVNRVVILNVKKL